MERVQPPNRRRKAVAFGLSGVLALSLAPAAAFGEAGASMTGVKGEAAAPRGVDEGWEPIGGLSEGEGSVGLLGSSDEAATDMDATAAADSGASAADPSASSQTPSAPAPLADGEYLIVPLSSRTRVLDVENGSSVDGANVRIWPDNSSPAQRFRVSRDVATGLYSVTCMATGKALDVAYGDARDGADVRQWKPNGTKAQRWLIERLADGSFAVKSALDTHFQLDVAAGADADGVNVQLWSPTGADAQRFFFVRAPADVAPSGRTVADGVYSLVGKGSGKALDVSGASFADGAPLQVWDAYGSMAQMFRFELDSEGFYRVTSLNSGKALDADRGGLMPGAHVNQWAAWATRSQQWSVRERADGAFELVNRANGQALDVAGGSTEAGARVQTWPGNGTPAQVWSIEPVSSVLRPGFYGVRSLLPGNRALDVAAGSADPGANAQTWAWNGTPAQRWLVSDAGGGAVTLEALCSGGLLTQVGSNVELRPADGTPAQRWLASPSFAGGVSLVNEATGDALNVWAGAAVDGANAEGLAPNGTPAQAWAFESVDPVGEGTYEVVLASDGRALDVEGGSRADGANVRAWSRNGSGAQAWRLRPLGGGWWSLENARSGKALDVAGGAAEPGANVQQWAAYGGQPQRWRVEYAGGGAYRLVSACGELALDVEGGGGRDGANAQLWGQNGTPAQSFRLVPTTYTPPAQEAVKRADGSWDWYNSNGVWDPAGARDKVMQTARSLLGVPYVWLGVYPQDGGMDCASFTWYVYQQLGITIGFETYGQMNDGYRVSSLDEAKPGDLILMYYGAWPNYNPLLPEHVVLYAGNGMVYEEPTFGGFCQYVPLSSKNADRIEIRRIIGD